MERDVGADGGEQRRVGAATVNGGHQPGILVESRHIAAGGIDVADRRTGAETDGKEIGGVAGDVRLGGLPAETGGEESLGIGIVYQENGPSREGRFGRVDKGLPHTVGHVLAAGGAEADLGHAVGDFLDDRPGKAAADRLHFRRQRPEVPGHAGVGKDENTARDKKPPAAGGIIPPDPLKGGWGQAVLSLRNEKARKNLAFFIEGIPKGSALWPPEAFPPPSRSPRLPDLAYFDAACGHHVLALADGVFAVVDDGGDERRRGFAFGDGVGHMFGRARAARGDDRNGHGFGHHPGQPQFVAGFFAVGVDGIEANFARAEGFHVLGPFQGIEAHGVSRRLPSVWLELALIVVLGTGLAAAMNMVRSDPLPWVADFAAEARREALRKGLETIDVHA